MLDLESVQRGAPRFDQSELLVEQESFGKEVFQRGSMALPEPVNGV